MGMADPEGIRKLEAILAADVAGYSRLMQDDDEATVATLEAYRAVFREKIRAHRGRVVDMAGDRVLAVFEAATGAVRAAFEIQGMLVERNEALPEARRMRFRIGVNLGEVIERPDGTVYGDGVNIAARLESIGEPAGVTVSGNVFDQVKNRVLGRTGCTSQPTSEALDGTLNERSTMHPDTRLRSPSAAEASLRSFRMLALVMS
jgi:adenylate cyclase